jgi:hypothetical protein
MKRAAEDMTEAEVARAKAQMKAGLLMGLESPSSRAERNARLLSIWGRVPDLDEAVEDRRRHPAGGPRLWRQPAALPKAALALYGPVEAAPGIEAILRGTGRVMLGLRRRSGSRPSG